MTSSHRPWHDLPTIPVWSPLHRRDWLVTPKQWRLLVRLFDGRRFTIRELATEMDYSVGGLHEALASLVTGGLIERRATLGRLGWTFAKVRRGAHAANVRQRVDALRSTTLRTVLPFLEGVVTSWRTFAREQEPERETTPRRAAG